VVHLSHEKGIAMSFEKGLASLTYEVGSATLMGLGRLQVVVVDGRCDRYDACYGSFFKAAAAGSMGVHVCIDGRSAVRLARRFRADCWLVATDLPDMSGFDLLEMLLPHVLQAEVDPLRSGAARSSADRAAVRHGGVFMVADSYSLADEQRALAAGIAGYLVRPVTLDVVSSMRISPRRNTAGLKSQP
jgi:PleD family two-component response regulator